MELSARTEGAQRCTDTLERSLKPKAIGDLKINSKKNVILERDVVKQWKRGTLLSALL